MSDGVNVYEYDSEILKTGFKLFQDKANEEDVSQFNEVFNQRARDGWELVSYTYMAEVVGIRNALLVTYKRQK